MSLYRQHKLHSGPGGPVVKKKKQAVAIQISMARKEGHHIPKPGEEVKGSFQHGGLVPEAGNYLLHGGEEIAWAKGGHPTYGLPSQDIEDRRSGSTRIADIVPQYEVDQRAAQERDIAARTNQAQHDEWNRAMRQKENYGGAMERGRAGDFLGTPPQPRDIPPAGNDPHYAIEGLKGNIAQRMHEQAERAVGPGYSSMKPVERPKLLGSYAKGGQVKQTGDYLVHEGEEIPDRYSGATRQNFTYPIRDTEAGSAPDLPSRYSAAKQQNFSYPIRDTEIGSAPDLPRGRSVVLGSFEEGGPAQPGGPARPRPGVVLGSFDEGGAVQSTGNYQAHAGEQVTSQGGDDVFHPELKHRTAADLVPQSNFGQAGGMPPPIRMTAPPPTVKTEKTGGGGYKAGTQDNPELRMMQANVAAPLHRVEGFKHGGTIPRTGIYRLHAGEHVIPKSLAGRYREMKAHG